ncbi:MAG: hypothetical protein ACT4O0_07085, partial [Pseudonocardia sp.]
MNEPRDLPPPGARRAAPAGPGAPPGVVRVGHFAAPGSAAVREPHLLTHDDTLDARNVHAAARSA